MQFSYSNLVRLFSSGWHLSCTQWSHRCRQPPWKINFTLNLRFDIFISVLNFFNILIGMDSRPPFLTMSVTTSPVVILLSVVNRRAVMSSVLNHSHLFDYTWEYLALGLHSLIISENIWDLGCIFAYLLPLIAKIQQQTSHINFEPKISKTRPSEMKVLP